MMSRSLLAEASGSSCDVGRDMGPRDLDVIARSTLSRTMKTYYTTSMCTNCSSILFSYRAVADDVTTVEPAHFPYITKVHTTRVI